MEKLEYKELFNKHNDIEIMILLWEKQCEIIDHIEKNKKESNNYLDADLLYEDDNKCETCISDGRQFVHGSDCTGCMSDKNNPYKNYKPIQKPASKLDKASYINTKISRLNNYVNSEDYVICVYKTNSMGDYVEDIDDLILDVLNEQAIKIDDDLIEWLKEIQSGKKEKLDVSDYAVAHSILKQLEE